MNENNGEPWQSAIKNDPRTEREMKRDYDAHIAALTEPAPAKRPSDRLSASQIEQAAEALREYEGQHLLEGIVAWENLNEKIKQHFRGKVRVVVDSIEVAE